MELDALQQVEKTAAKKLKLFRHSKTRYLMRAILAAMFIGFGVIVSYKTGNLFYLVDSPLAYPVAAATFSTAIIIISYTGTDLFTGNTFYFTYSTLRKKMQWGDTFKLWTFTYVGNLIGAALFAVMIWLTNVMADPSANSFLLYVVDHKVNATNVEIFFRGILCNWLVSLAFFIPMWMKHDGAKIFAMIMCVFGFFVSGFEHSIANMGAFSIALFLDLPDTITLAGMIRNIIMATLGNIVGGGLFMGVLYYYLNKPFYSDNDTECESH